MIVPDSMIGGYFPEWIGMDRATEIAVMKTQEEETDKIVRSYAALPSPFRVAGTDALHSMPFDLSVFICVIRGSILLNKVEPTEY